jgi:hypothetical protein
MLRDSFDDVGSLETSLEWIQEVVDRLTLETVEAEFLCGVGCEEEEGNWGWGGRRGFQRWL